MDEQEYKKIVGLDSVDLGSIHALRKEVARLAKELGYRTAEFYAMPKYQLKTVFKKLSAKRDAIKN